MISVIHVMKDGSVIKDIKGYKVPNNKDTKEAYDILYKQRIKKN